MYSHAGVLSKFPAFDLTVSDIDQRLASSAASFFNVGYVDQISNALLRKCECVIICSPTATHFQFLKNALEIGVPYVVCEKPVCDSIADLEHLRSLKKRSKSRVVVNYTRRFQPFSTILKVQFDKWISEQPLRAISIRYQRGFLNNASHALDLIQFLSGWEISTARIKLVQSVFDEIPNDPTICGHGEWGGAVLSILGLPNVRFSLFEIDLFFERTAIRLRDRGGRIEYAESEEPSEYYAPLKTTRTARTNMQTPLKNLYRHVQRMISNPDIQDNFTESLELNKWILSKLIKVKG